MAKNEEKFEKVDRIYKEYGDRFEGSFHTVLWGMIVNVELFDARAAFHVSVENHFMLVIALAAGGYVSTPAYFKARDYHEACQVAQLLSCDVFGYDSIETVQEVVDLSLRNGHVL